MWTGWGGCALKDREARVVPSVVEGGMSVLVCGIADDNDDGKCSAINEVVEGEGMFGRDPLVGNDLARLTESTL